MVTSKEKLFAASCVSLMTTAVAFSIRGDVGDPLARKLIESARKRQVVDLSVVLSEKLPISWPGRGTGNHRQPYLRIRLGENANTRTDLEAHMLGSHTGTHLVPPGYTAQTDRMLYFSYDQHTSGSDGRGRHPTNTRARKDR